jgi:CubicO group peptidase (beta-lactamase class C family)
LLVLANVDARPEAIMVGPREGPRQAAQGHGGASARVARARPGWRALAILSCLAGAACVPPTEPVDTTTPTPWEIRPASSVDGGTTYWPAEQWRTALPSQVGMDSASMATLSHEVRELKWPTMHSLLVVHRGYLVFNEYLGGMTPDTIQPLQAATTMVTGLIVGVAVREGKLRVTDGVGPLFPEYGDIAAAGTKSAMTVDYLMTMRTGLDFREEPYQGSLLQALNQSKVDWLRLILSQALNGGNGDRWRYNSGSAILLGGMIHSVTGEAADVYAGRTLFAPLGITKSSWFIGQPNGLPQMGGGLSLTAPEMARIGYLMLRNGRWNGAPIVTEAWVASMRERKSRNVGQWSAYSLDYGRMMWVLPPISGTGDVDVLAASGGGGQWIFVVPAKDLVVVATGDASSIEDFAKPIQLLYNVVVPATQ